MKHIHFLLLFFLFIGSSCVKKNTAEQPAHIIWEELDTVPSSFGTVSYGVSAAFVGFRNEKLIVAGGCNFPDVPAAKGGKKVFYNEILCFDGNRWSKIGELPCALAYGVSINLPHALLCIGGRNNDYLSSSVFIVKLDPKSGKALIDSLPALPVPMDNFGGAVADSVIYLVGGNQNGATTNAVWSFDLRENATWLKLPPVPSRDLLQPAVAAQNRALYVFGGYDNPRNISADYYSGKTATDIPAEVSQKVWKYSPQAKTWTQAANYPAGEGAYSLSGGAAVAVDDSLILTFGGVNKRVFEEALNRNFYLKLPREKPDKVRVKLEEESKEYMLHAPEWYKFNPRMMIFNTKTNTWQALSEFGQTALAGTSVVKDKNVIYVVNGEIKPGIRTSKIGKITWKGK